MTNEEMLAIVEARTGVTDTTLLSAYIADAGQAIINKAYPFKPDIATVPLKYQRLQVEIAVYLANKMGAEGQTMHIENGIHRTYESASIPNSMLKAVMPLAKIPVPPVEPEEEESEEEESEEEESEDENP